MKTVWRHVASITASLVVGCLISWQYSPDWICAWIASGALIGAGWLLLLSGVRRHPSRELISACPRPHCPLNDVLKSNSESPRSSAESLAHTLTSCGFLNAQVWVPALREPGLRLIAISSGGLSIKDVPRDERFVALEDYGGSANADCLTSRSLIVCGRDAVASASLALVGADVDHFLLVPMDFAHNAPGLVIVGVQNRQQLTPQIIDTVTRLVAASGLAVFAAVSERHTKRSVRRINIVSEALAQIGPHSPFEEVSRTVLEATSRAMQTPTVALFTIDSYTGSVKCDSTGYLPDAVQDAFMKLYGAHLSDREDRDVWILAGVAESELQDSAAQQSLIDAGIMHVLAAPIRSKVCLNGALVAFYNHDRAFLRDHAQVLDAIAAQASVTMSFILALEQSQFLLDDLAGANQELSVQATIDGLTGLANHRTLQQKLAEICRANSKGDKAVFSLVMVDVDHFKLYNDTHGHQEGDGVLRRVAKTLSSQLRPEDLAARYGGEEFALVLVGIGKDSAVAVADRIRRAISEHALRKGSITVSMGISEFPADGVAPNEIIELADRALYHAKITGRNRVVVWGEEDAVLTEANPSPHNENSRKNILVVERKSESSAAAICASLRSDSYGVVAVETLSEAAEMLRTTSFHIALISADALPGHEPKAISTVTAVHPDLPVIFISESIQVEAGRDALRYGASDVLTKPLNPAELPLAVERTIERRRIERARLAQKSTSLLLQAIEALVAAIDSKDHYSAGHSQRVCSYAMAITEELNMSTEDRYATELAAKLHDVGKLALPDSALNKEAKLTDAEWTAMRDHPVLGSRIVGTIEELAYVATIIRHHHERLDGSGYPDGLKGPAIPFLARVIAVADAFEAMTAERAHRGRLTPQEAIDELWRDTGSRYSAEIVQALESRLLEEGELDHPARDRAA